LAEGSLSAEGSLLAEGSFKNNAPSPGDRLTAVIDFMESEKGQLNLVFLAISQSWDYARRYMRANQNRLGNIHGLVLLNVNLTVKLSQLPETIPILDIDTNRQTSSDYRARRIDAQRSNAVQYRQIHLPMRPWQFNLREDQLSKRIRGWLSVNVRGMELETDEAD